MIWWHLITLKILNNCTFGKSAKRGRRSWDRKIHGKFNANIHHFRWIYYQRWWILALNSMVVRFVSWSESLLSKEMSCGSFLATRRSPSASRFMGSRWNLEEASIRPTFFCVSVSKLQNATPSILGRVTPLNQKRFKTNQFWDILNWGHNINSLFSVLGVRVLGFWCKGTECRWYEWIHGDFGSWTLLASTSCLKMISL